MSSVFWFWLLFWILGSCLLFLLPALWIRETYSHYRGSRAVSCPQTRQQVAVSVDALHAAVSGLFGRPDLRLRDCTLWPQRFHCGQECIPEALQTKPYTQGEMGRSELKKIYHLPVLIAAFAGWLLGAIWHSQYVFRPRWMEAMGLNIAQLRQIVKWWSPHVLSVTACVLFAYGVAWLLTWSKQKGVWRGMVAATLLWFVVALGTVFAAARVGISRELLMLELGYTLLASLVAGAIIGGLSDKLRIEQP